MSIDDKMLDDLLKSELTSTDKGLTLVAEKDRSLNFSFVGVGQAGGHIVETCYNFGYSVGAINTAIQDLKTIKVPERKKMLLDIGLAGAGKDLVRGEEAINQYRNEITAFLNTEVVSNTDMTFLVISGGGGSGAGSVMPMVDILASLGRPVGVIYVLPMHSDDAQAKKNALLTLARLAKLSTTNVISTLIVVDNSKIETMFGNLAMSEFWHKANNAIIEPLHLFNTLTNQASAFTSLDSADFGKILTYGDISLYGMIDVDNFLDETALAEAAINSLEGGLLASHFDLKQAKVGGVLVVGSKEILETIPANNVNYLFHVLSEQTNDAALYKGIYSVNTDKKSIQIYCWFSGLGLPLERVSALKQESAAQEVKAEEKLKTRATAMTLDIGEKTTSAAQEVHRKIQQKNSAFNKIGTNQVGIVDRRKK